MLLDAIQKYGVYKDERLRNLVSEFESRFQVKDEIDFFNNLVNFSTNVEIPYHCWFKYREGFSHALIEELIKRSAIDKSEYVADPFCGSGTTVIEAALQGYSGLGIDINPMSAFISSVKCTSYSDNDISRIQSLYQQLSELIGKIVVSNEYRQQYADVEKFFSKNNFEELIKVKMFVDSITDNDKVHDFYKCAYICIIEEVSDRKRDGNGLKTQASTVNDVVEFFGRKVSVMLSDITTYRIPADVVAILDMGNAMTLSETINKNQEKMNGTLGAIMYSPPYANSFDYFESYKMEVILADYAINMQDIGQYRQQAVESFVGRNDLRNDTRDFIQLMSDEIEKGIPEKEERTGRRDSRTRKVPKMIRGYFTDMEQVIAESSKVLTSGKKCYIVVDQSAYLGRIVPTDLFLAAIAEDYDFNVNEIIICRQAKTSGQQIQLYPYLADSLRESIVVLEKR